MTDDTPTTPSAEAMREALNPVWHWYQPDDRPDRPLIDILSDVVGNLIDDRDELLRLRKDTPTPSAE